MNRNIPLEALRFLFMSFLCLAHFDYNFAITSLHHGYLVVEFFFIVSGFFLYRFFISHPEIGTLDFTIHRIKKFVVPVFICLLLIMLLDRKQFFYPPSVVCADTLMDKYFSHIHEFFFLQGIGLTERMPISFPLWFIGVLLVGGGIIHSLLRNYYQKAVSLFIPIMILFAISYNYWDGNLCIGNVVTHIRGIHPSLVRGISEIGLGVMTAHIYARKLYFFNRNTLLLDIWGVICLIGFIIMLFARGNFDYLVYFFIPSTLVMCFNPHSVINRVFASDSTRIITNWLGGLSMYMFFIHGFVGTFIVVYNSNYADTYFRIDIFPYYVMVIVLSYLLKKVSSIIRSHISVLT